MQLDALQSLALSVAAARSPDAVLTEMIHGLGMWEGVALARVWLLREGSGESPYLELNASIGASQLDPSKRWNRIDGAHHKIPLSYGKVGLIASTNQPLLLKRGPRAWIVHPEWAHAEGIQSFAGQPLCFKGQVLGVVAFFSRKSLDKRDLDWLRVFADQAAVAIATARAFEEIARLRQAAQRELPSALLAGESPPTALTAESAAMRRVLSQIAAVAQADSSVLIEGESGVGKELVASAIHAQSHRRDGPFVKVNCASVPRELFESEFFGHVRGAFSGASRDRQGRFLLADGGTLFLDEVGEIPIELQSKLLRVLQEQAFEPVGDDRTRRVNVRVVAATNRPLEQEVEQGRFRRDLYYRLSVLPIFVPPLRERREDILPLARRFLQAASQRLRLPLRALSAEDEDALLAHAFPGNVRELQNLVERAVVLGADGSAGVALELSSRAPAPAAAVANGLRAEELAALAREPDREAAVVADAVLRDFERQNLLNALARCDFQIAGERGAARLLGLSPSTLSYRLKQLGIERPR